MKCLQKYNLLKNSIFFKTFSILFCFCLHCKMYLMLNLPLFFFLFQYFLLQIQMKIFLKDNLLLASTHFFMQFILYLQKRFNSCLSASLKNELCKVKNIYFIHLFKNS